MVRADAISTIVLLASPGTNDDGSAGDFELSKGYLIHFIKIRPLSNVYNKDSNKGEY
jgi:hypothetical protein